MWSAMRVSAPPADSCSKLQNYLNIEWYMWGESAASVVYVILSGYHQRVMRIRSICLMVETYAGKARVPWKSQPS